MGRRLKGEGAIYLRGDGRWEAQLRLGAGRYRSVYGRTRREVLGKLREAHWAIKRGLPVQLAKSDTRAVPRELTGGGQEPGQGRHP
jgi:hypothetical protein